MINSILLFARQSFWKMKSKSAKPCLQRRSMTLSKLWRTIEKSWWTFSAFSSFFARRKKQHAKSTRSSEHSHSLNLYSSAMHVCIIARYICIYNISFKIRCRNSYSSFFLSFMICVFVFSLEVKTVSRNAASGRHLWLLESERFVSKVGQNESL